MIRSLGKKINMKFDIRRYATCSSTNDVAGELARRGASEGTVVVAEEQTAGRGTKGRAWHSMRGKGLYVSLVLRPPTPMFSLIPLAAGLAAAEAVRRSHRLSVRLRWPNDIFWKGKKLGGILCESVFLGNRPDYVILGVGLNVDHDEGDFPVEIRASAVSIKMATGRKADAESLLRRLLAGLERWSDVHSGPDGGRKIVRAFERVSVARKGDPLTVIMGQERIPGVYEGIDSAGALLLRGENGIRRFASAEILGMENGHAHRH
jgi:BirA family biotin operon repressor/biotin-[acetyl-CoA-carboxylase] ligase